MVDTKSNMQLADLNYKPHSGKILRNLIDRAIGAWFYPPPVSLHYQKLFLVRSMIQITSIVSKIRKTRSKRQRYPMYKIVLYKPAHIRSKRLRNYIIFFFTCVNNQLITNHPRISVLISFVCSDIITGYQCITRAVNIIRKARLLLLCSIILHYIRRCTCMH